MLSESLCLSGVMELADITCQLVQLVIMVVGLMIIVAFLLSQYGAYPVHG